MTSHPQAVQPPPLQDENASLLLPTWPDSSSSSSHKFLHACPRSSSSGHGASASSPRAARSGLAMPLSPPMRVCPPLSPLHRLAGPMSKSCHGGFSEDLHLPSSPSLRPAARGSIPAWPRSLPPPLNARSTEELTLKDSAKSDSASCQSPPLCLDRLPSLINEPLSSPQGSFADHLSSFQGTDVWRSCVPSRASSFSNSLPLAEIGLPPPLYRTAQNSSFDSFTSLPVHSIGLLPAEVAHRLSYGNTAIKCKRHVDKGVTLTWKDLWVTLSDNSAKRARPLLQSSTGFADPGNMMAIMGPSGSGKSTLLDALAGRLSPNVKQVGEVMVNGRRQVLSYGNSAYVTQDDVLLASLTVWEAIFYSAQLQLPKTMSNEDKKQRAVTIIKEMGLQKVINSRIGGWRARGVSGGEKRRVSIAIELLTRPRLLFLDEPTSGLDSAAAFNLVKRLRLLAVEGRTIVVSIHQPSGDVFELFDHLYLLSGGRTVYFGSTVQAPEFFSVNGLPCPPHQNLSEHYLRTINTDYEEDMEDVAVCDQELKIEQVINVLINAYANSDVAFKVKNRIRELLKQEGEILHTASDRPDFLAHVRILTRRSFKNMHRDLGYYWLRLAMYIVLSICIGTVYFNVGSSFDDIQARAALLMFVSGLLTLMAITGFPSFIEDLKVFDRERLNGHYGVASFFVANTLSSCPFLLLIAIIPGAIAYVLAGLHAGVDRFAFFVLDLYISVLVVESLMMMVASLVSDYLIGLILGTGIQGLYLLTGGFFRLPHEIPKPVWRCPISYMSFHTYSIQGFYRNDFEGLTFQDKNSGRPPLAGNDILRESFQVMNISKWLDLLILVGMVVIYRFLFFSVIKMKERLRPIIRNFVSWKRILRISTNGDDSLLIVSS